MNKNAFALFFLIYFGWLGSVFSVPLDFSGPQIDVPIANLSGWSSCYRYSYAQAGVPLSELFTNCTGPRLMFACGQNNVQTYDVVSSTDYSFISALMSTTGTADNGAFWYRGDGTGIGFTDGSIDLQPCDIDSPGQREALCWQLDGSGNLIIGGRCSGAVALGAGSTSYYRELLFNPCDGQSDGTACDDNNFCTTNTTCINQECVGVDIPPPSVGQCYKLGSCDPKTGVYAVSFRTSGVSCEDGDPCTISDVCDGAGTCLSGPPFICPAPPGQCYQSGTCNSTSGSCDYPPRALGTSCNDGLYCTTPDQCDGAGTCVGVGNRTCVSTTQCREPGVCNEGTNSCDFPISPDGTACFINDACVNTSVCISGTCTPQTGTICPPPTDCQVSSTCNPNTGQCDIVDEVDGTGCDDSDLCTTSDQCLSGICVGTPVTCTAAGPCYEVGTCNPGTGLCSNPFSSNTKQCTDGNACTSPDLCDGAGSCIPGPAVVCSALGQCDTAGACNPSFGCPFTPLPDGSPCDDGDVCTINDACQTGNCQSGELDLYNPYCFDTITTGTTSVPGGSAATLPCIFAL